MLSANSALLARLRPWDGHRSAAARLLSSLGTAPIASAILAPATPSFVHVDPAGPEQLDSHATAHTLAPRHSRRATTR